MEEALPARPQSKIQPALRYRTAPVTAVSTALATGDFAIAACIHPLSLLIMLSVVRFHHTHFHKAVRRETSTCFRPDAPACLLKSDYCLITDNLHRISAIYLKCFIFHLPGDLLRASILTE